MTAPVVNTVFVPGTTITHEWLNGVNDYVNESNPADHSSANVEYQPAGTGAVTTTVQTKLQEYVSVKDFGAVGDGVTDDSTSITEAIVYANSLGGATVFFPAGNYICKNVSLLSNVTIEASGATITKKSDALDTEPIFIANGSVSGTVTTLTATATINDTSIAVTNASGFAAGDLVLVYSNDYAYSTHGRNQEIQKIKSITGNTIYFYGGLIANYATTSSASVAKLNAIQNCHINGGTYIIANGTKGGALHFVYSYGCSVKNTDISGMDYYAGILLEQSAFFEITSNFIHDGQNCAPGGDRGDPIIVNESSQNITITNNIFKNYTEIPFTNGSKYIVFDGNDCSGMWDSGVNTHGSGNYGVIISNNSFVGSQQYGIAVGFSTHNAGDRQVNISNNTIKFTQSAGISIAAPTGKENVDITVDGNIVSYAGLRNTGSVGIGITNTINAVVSNNAIDNFLNGYAVFLNLVSIGNVVGNSINGATNAYGFGLQDSTVVSIQNNIMTNIDSYVIYTTGTNTNCNILNNTSDTTSYSIGSTIQTWGNSFQTFTGSATYDPPSLTNGSGATTTVTVTGALAGGYASATFSNDLQGITVTAWVSASNTISVRFQNQTGSTIDLASGTLKVRVTNAIGA